MMYLDMCNGHQAVCVMEIFGNFWSTCFIMLWSLVTSWVGLHNIEKVISIFYSAFTLSYAATECFYLLADCYWKTSINHYLSIYSMKKFNCFTIFRRFSLKCEIITCTITRETLHWLNTLFLFNYLQLNTIYVLHIGWFSNWGIRWPHIPVWFKNIKFLITPSSIIHKLINEMYEKFDNDECYCV